MTMNIAKQLLSMMLSILLIFALTPVDAGAQQAGYSGQGVPLSAQELQQLVAPIALYPDSLVAQILGAATFPDQVAAAASWLQQNSYLTGTVLMQTVNGQPWEPSVKALTQFPSVLANLAKNLSWTSSLGEAYSTQGADVMSAVQYLRAQALAAGNLKIRITTGGCATVATSDLDSAREPAGGLRSRVQLRGGLRLPLCSSRVRRASRTRCGDRSDCVRSRHRGRGDDERRLLRVGI